MTASEPGRPAVGADASTDAIPVIHPVPGPSPRPAGWTDRPVPASGVANLPRTPWTFVDVLAGLGLLLILTVVISAGVAVTGDRPDRSVLALLSLMATWIALVATSWWACRRHGTGSPVRDLGLSFRWPDLWIGVLAGLGLRIGVMIIAVIAASITRYQGGASSNLPVELTAGTGMLIITAVAVTLLAPLVEELFFRGLLLRSALESLNRRAYRPRLANPITRIHIAVLTSAALFAVIHLSEADSAFSATVLFLSLSLVGWVNARLTLWSNRLGPAIVSHAVFNGTALILLLITQR
ncbi:MAG TPA: type II CAAX endopeptidase family protein [Nakamurella sp.]|nr:type II CAAX endopeptidase family protein [Nakamurella sp.]